MKPPAPVPLFLVNADEPYAYACGHCGFVRVSYSCHRKWDGKDTNSTRAEAERCCACFACGEFNPRDASTDRYSMPCFIHPRKSVDLTPMASAVARTGGEVHYRSLDAGTYLTQRLAEIGLG